MQLYVSDSVDIACYPHLILSEIEDVKPASFNADLAGFCLDLYLAAIVFDYTLIIFKVYFVSPCSRYNRSSGKDIWRKMHNLGQFLKACQPRG